MCGGVSVPVTRSTSVPPKASGAVRLRTSLENALEAPPSSGSPPPLAWPQKIMIAPARKLSILSMPSLRILEQSKPGGISGLICCDLVVTRYFCCACAGVSWYGFAVAKSASEMPANPTTRPTSTRKLKNADCEVDFFFMSGAGYGGNGGQGMKRCFYRKWQKGVNTFFNFLRFDCIRPCRAGLWIWIGQRCSHGRVYLLRRVPPCCCGQ